MLKEQRCWRNIRICPYGKHFLRELYSWSEDNPLHPMLAWKVCEENCPAEFNSPPPLRMLEYFGNEKEWLLDITPEAHNWLGMYVQKKLLASNVIPEDEANPENPESIAAGIIYNSWSQPYVIYYADMLIERAIKFPPDPISTKHFSLKAFVDRNR